MTRRRAERANVTITEPDGTTREVVATVESAEAGLVSLETAPGRALLVQFAKPEPPQRMTGWRHLPEERWTRDRITPAPWNAKVRRMARAHLARLKRGLDRHGLAGTLNVRAEDGLLLGGTHRFVAMCDLIDGARELFAADAAAYERELERLGVSGGLFRVSPILGIPDAEAAALSVLLNNREAQGDFDPMGLAEILSLIDAEGFNLEDTGFDLEAAEALITWEADDTKQGGAKSAGAEGPAPDAPAGSTIPRKKMTRRAVAVPFHASDLTLAARALERLATEEPTTAAAARAAAARLVAGAGQWPKLLEAGAITEPPPQAYDLAGDSGGLTFE